MTFGGDAEGSAWRRPQRDHQVGRNNFSGRHEVTIETASRGQQPDAPDRAGHDQYKLILTALDPQTSLGGPVKNKIGGSSVGHLIGTSYCPRLLVPGLQDPATFTVPRTRKDHSVTLGPKTKGHQVLYKPHQLFPGSKRECHDAARQSRSFIRTGSPDWLAVELLGVPSPRLVYSILVRHPRLPRRLLRQTRSRSADQHRSGHQYQRRSLGQDRRRGESSGQRIDLIRPYPRISLGRHQVKAGMNFSSLGTNEPNGITVTATKVG